LSTRCQVRVLSSRAAPLAGERGREEVGGGGGWWWWWGCGRAGSREEGVWNKGCAGKLRPRSRLISATTDKGTWRAVGLGGGSAASPSTTTSGRGLSSPLARRAPTRTCSKEANTVPSALIQRSQALAVKWSGERERERERENGGAERGEYGCTDGALRTKMPPCRESKEGEINT
jgi:hypothetical protein